MTHNDDIWMCIANRIIKNDIYKYFVDRYNLRVTGIEICNFQRRAAVLEWDVEIIEKMPQDLDHVLFYNDGYCGSKLNTMCILGRKYYERFHYIYHPAYKSLWCDNEFMEVADMLGKQTYYNTCLFRHDHFANNKLFQLFQLFFLLLLL